MRAPVIKGRAGRWNKGLTLVAAVALSLGFVGAIANADVTRVEALEFSRVQLIGSNELEITQGDTSTLKIRGDGDDLDPPPFVLEGDLLRLGITAFARPEDRDGAVNAFGGTAMDWEEVRTWVETRWPGGTSAHEAAHRRAGHDSHTSSES